MRAALAFSLALSLALPAVAAEAVPPGAEAAVAAVRGVLKSAKSATVRKIKINAAGDVCALISPSAGSDELEFIWTKATGQVWINEAEGDPYSEFVYSAPNLRRSDARSDYQAWKACQKG